MKKLVNLAKWTVTLGNKPQAFLGAKWIQSFLRRIPESKKHLWALRILSLSPHYFIKPDGPEYKHLSYDKYLEATFKDCVDSRVRIYDSIFKDRLPEDSTVLDYGCGPGFLARVIADHVRKVYAVDISEGALGCARILNAADNLEYLMADETGLEKIPDETVDAVTSFAMVQHLSDEIFEIVLENCRQKLKPGGKLLLHIQLENSTWRTEEDWKSDKTLTGKIKYRYALHCFGRTKEAHAEIVAKHQFENIEMEPIASLLDDDSEDVNFQYLLTARKIA